MVDIPEHAFTTAFKVRFYECDSFDHVNNVNYLRYMQEAAFDASAALGYDRQRFRSLGLAWIVRETCIDYLAPAQYGDTLEVATWVEDVDRLRSRRQYRFRLPGDDRVIATAWTDWVMISAEKGNPVMIPDDIRKAFAPPTNERISRQRFYQPPAPATAFQVCRNVEWRDIDPWRHVHNAAYLAFVEDAGMKVGEHFGWPVERMQDAGFVVLARRHHLEYRKAVHYNDEIELRTWISRFGGATADRHYELRRDGQSVLACNSVYAWVNTQSGRPMRIPADFRIDFAANIFMTPPISE